MPPNSFSSDKTERFSSAVASFAASDDGLDLVRATREEVACDDAAWLAERAALARAARHAEQAAEDAAALADFDARNRPSAGLLDQLRAQLVGAESYRRELLAVFAGPSGEQAPRESGRETLTERAISAGWGRR